MIVHPRIGQPVRVHYRKQVAAIMPFEGMVGLVLGRSRGPGPRNHLVFLHGHLVVIPCGNINTTKGAS